MEVLLALFLDTTFSPTEKPVASYQVNTCYHSDSIYRPNTIRIVETTNTSYKYKIYYDYTKLWGEDLEQSISTIETVYTSETPCP